MAVCAHGDAKTSPIPGRQSPTFMTLCNWLDQTLADNPHLRDKTPSPPGTVTRALPVTEDKVFARPLPPLPGMVAAQTAPTADGAPTPPPIVAPAAPAAPPTVAEGPPDEFAGYWFNREFHPNRK